MAIITNRYQQFYTHDGKIFDLNTVDWNNNLLDIEQKYGWEAAMAFTNLVHDDINIIGRGVREGDVVIDLGANIGMSALNMERKKADKIYCVEPDRRSYETLLLNKNKNWIADNFAISSSSGTVKVGEWPYQTTADVRAITLDQYFAQHNLSYVNFMKVDIEGNENHVFDTVSQSTMDKIESMAIEYHEDESQSFEQKNFNRSKFVDKFVSKGFTNYAVLIRMYQSMIYFWK